MIGIILLMAACASWSSIMYRVVFLMKRHAAELPWFTCDETGMLRVRAGYSWSGGYDMGAPEGDFTAIHVMVRTGGELKRVDAPMRIVHDDRYLDLPIACDHRFEQIVLTGACKAYQWRCVSCGRKR